MPLIVKNRDRHAAETVNALPYFDHAVGRVGGGFVKVPALGVEDAKALALSRMGKRIGGIATLLANEDPGEAAVLIGSPVEKVERQDGNAIGSGAVAGVAFGRQVDEDRQPAEDLGEDEAAACEVITGGA